jgi:hypothetical protein
MPVDLNIKCVNLISIDLNCSLVDNLNISTLLIILLVLTYMILKGYNKLKNYKSYKKFNSDKRN